MKMEFTKPKGGPKEPGMKTLSLRGIVLAVVALAAVVAAAVFVVPLARQRSQNVSQGRQWAGLLKKHPAFSAKLPACPVDVTFSYAGPTDENLTKLRDMYGLEAVAGRGPETDRIINLMSWVYHLTGHANEPEIPEERNALNLIPLARDKHMMINCYLKTVILNEVCLAMGFESRQTHLLPAENEDEESHYITSVFSRTLGRWILMDPDFGVYVTNEEGAILGIAEIRRRLIAGEPLAVKAVDAPRNLLARAWSNVQNFIDGTNYLWYLRKNIFKIECPRKSLFNLAAERNRVHFELIPDGYREELLRAPEITKQGKRIVFMNDEGLFWQKPDGTPAER
jgi:hypothetical protein